MSELDVVTGALSYSGKYITTALLEKGRRVRTLTGHPDRPNPFGDSIEIARLDFNDADALAADLSGTRTLYNTYWVRFNHGRVSFDLAVKNSMILFEAARAAGVERIVHISITNPSSFSPLPYFRGKALVEQALMNTGLSYAIVRPTVIFGGDDILINNIAWIARRFPVFPLPERGLYRIQLVSVEDVARICVEAGQEAEDLVLEATGPEVYTFGDLVGLIASAVGARSRIVSVPLPVAIALSKIVGLATKDLVVTRQELKGLIAELAVGTPPSLGRIRFSSWLLENAQTLGRDYRSELARNFRPALARLP